MTRSKSFRLIALSCLTLVLVAASSALAQRPTVTPYHANGIYDTGDKVGWTAALPPGATAPAAPYTYTIKKDNFGDPIKTGTLDLADGSATIEVTVDEPCMLYVQVSAAAGSERSGRAGRGSMALGAAVAPTKLEPSAPHPADFGSFWEAKIKALNEIPMKAELTPGDSGRPSVEFYTFKLDSLGSTAHGYLAKPAREGKFPGVVILQWAGVYAVPKDAVLDRAAEGWLALDVDAHDKAPDAPDGPPLNYQSVGNTDRETSYFLNMYLRDYRAIDYLTSRPEWDGKTLLLMGTSMGGQQSLCLAGLHPKVTHLIVNVPAGCDMCGPLHGRASGYPNWSATDPAVMRTAPYFDAVNFASHIEATSLVAMGFVDTVSPPVGVWIAFNQIKGPKEAVPMVDSPHNHVATPQQQRPYTIRSRQWLDTLVKGEPVKPDTSKVRPGVSIASVSIRPIPRTDRNSQIAHAQLLEKAKKGRIDIYFEGDSIMRRWGALDYPQLLANWKQNFFGWNAADFAWGGDTVQNILWRLENGELDDVHPKVIVLQAGTNNLPWRGPANEAAVADVVAGLQAIIAFFQEHAPDATIVLTALFPRSQNMDLKPTIDEINKKLATLADGKKIRFVNINDKLADSTGRLLPGMSRDGLHLEEKGCQVWADALKPIFTELLGPPADEDHAPPPTGDPSAAGRPTR